MRSHFRFPRDTDGNYDKNRTCNDGTIKEYTFKYNTQVRLLLGCAQKRGDEGTLVGWRLPAFDYTQKKMISVNGFNKKEKIEVSRVKMEGKIASGWTIVLQILLTSVISRVTLWCCGSWREGIDPRGDRINWCHPPPQQQKSNQNRSTTCKLPNER